MSAAARSPTSDVPPSTRSARPASANVDAFAPRDLPGREDPVGPALRDRAHRLATRRARAHVGGVVERDEDRAAVGTDEVARPALLAGSDRGQERIGHDAPLGGATHGDVQDATWRRKSALSQ